MSIEAMKRAMDALKVAENSTEYMHLGEYFAEIRKELCQVIAKAEKESTLNGLAETSREIEQKPVAWMQDRYELYIQSYPDEWYKIPLYTAPPKRECTRSHPHENMDAMCELRTDIARLTNENERLKHKEWVGLTDEEIAEGVKQSWVTEQAFESAVWWAETKLKEKNT